MEFEAELTTTNNVRRLKKKNKNKVGHYSAVDSP